MLRKTILILPAILFVSCTTTYKFVKPSWVQLDNNRLTKSSTIAVVIGRDEPCYSLLHPKYGTEFSILSRPALAEVKMQESRLKIDKVKLAQALVEAFESHSKFQVKAIREVAAALQSIEIDILPSDETWGNQLPRNIVAQLQRLDVDIVCVAWVPISSWSTGDYLLIKLFSIPDGTAIGSYKTFRQPMEERVSFVSESYYFSRYDPEESARSMATEAVEALLTQIK